MRRVITTREEAQVKVASDVSEKLKLVEENYAISNTQMGSQYCLMEISLF